MLCTLKTDNTMKYNLQTEQSKIRKTGQVTKPDKTFVSCKFDHPSLNIYKQFHSEAWAHNHTGISYIKEEETLPFDASKAVEK